MPDACVGGSGRKNQLVHGRGGGKKGRTKERGGTRLLQNRGNTGLVLLKAKSASAQSLKKQGGALVADSA